MPELTLAKAVRERRSAETRARQQVSQPRLLDGDIGEKDIQIEGNGSGPPGDSKQQDVHRSPLPCRRDLRTAGPSVGVRTASIPRWRSGGRWCPVRAQRFFAARQAEEESLTAVEWKLRLLGDRTERSARARPTRWNSPVRDVTEEQQLRHRHSFRDVFSK